MVEGAAAQSRDLCLPGRPVRDAGACRIAVLSTLPGGVPPGLATQAAKQDRVGGAPSAGASDRDGSYMAIAAIGDLTMATTTILGPPLPAPGTTIGILWRDQRILARVLTVDDPPGVFYAAFRVASKRRINAYRADDSPYFWWFPLAGGEQKVGKLGRAQHAGHGRASPPRLPLFDGLPPRQRPPRKRRTAEQIAQSRAKASATRARNKIAARRAEAAREIALTAARACERATWIELHRAPTQAELETIRGMFPNLNRKDRT